MDVVYQGRDMGIVAPYSLLSTAHHTLHTSFLPIHAYMFRIRPTGSCQAWTHQRTVVGSMADIKMQSLGGQRI